MQNLGLSPSTPKPTSRLKELFWPDVSDETGARTASHLAMWASFLIAGISTAIALLGAAPKAALLDAALFALIGLGIRKMSRTAAVCGLLLYVLEQVYAVVERRAGFGVIAIIVTFLFVSSIRGTFGYHRRRKRGAPAVE